MGPKSKKPKALTPEEIAAKEEEARKLKELEEKRLAEEQRLRELEEARIQAERKAIREEEYARLVVELEERGKLISASNEKREEVEAIQKAEEEWEKFRETDDDCIAITQKELNTFCAICDESKVKSLREALDIVQKIETVATDVKNYWADCLASNNIQEQKQCVSYLIHFNRTIMDLLDTGTAYILKDPPSVGGDRDLHLEEVASGVMIGLWGCLMERPGNRKSVQFEKCGVQLDIPKQVFSAGRLVHRVIRTPLETFNLFPYDNSTIIDGEKTLVTNDKIVVGDLYIMEILHPPKESHHIVSLKWCMKDNSKATYMIHRSPYPSSVPIRCFIKVPDTVVMSNDIRIAVWDEENNEFTEEGVTEFQYSESTRMVQFHITVLGTFALVRNRTAHFPYKRFNISPFRDLRQMDYYEKMVRVNIVAGNVDVTIGVTGPNCFIAKTTSKPLLDIINKHMSPGKLLYELQKRGVNLLPTALDLTSATLDVMKDAQSEDSVLEEIARTANSIEYQSMPWNQQLGTHEFGICCRESTLFSAREESFDYECVLGVKDDNSETYRNYTAAGTLVGNGCSSSAVKYLLVMGNEYGDKKHYSVTPRPDEVSHMQIATCMSSRITPEAMDRINFQNEQLTAVVLKLLRLVRPFSYS